MTHFLSGRSRDQGSGAPGDLSTIAGHCGYTQGLLVELRLLDILLDFLLDDHLGRGLLLDPGGEVGKVWLGWFRRLGRVDHCLKFFPTNFPITVSIRIIEHHVYIF